MKYLIYYNFFYIFHGNLFLSSFSLNVQVHIYTTVRAMHEHIYYMPN